MQVFDWVIRVELAVRPPEQEDGDELRGRASGGGRHVGAVRLVEGPDDFARVMPGDVIVCEITTPTWAPMFAVAGGLVTDEGGAALPPGDRSARGRSSGGVVYRMRHGAPPRGPDGRSGWRPGDRAGRVVRAGLAFLLDARRAVGVMQLCQELGLLGLLADEALGVDDLAARVELSPAHTSAILGALAALGLAHERSGRWHGLLSKDTLDFALRLPLLSAARVRSPIDVGDPAVAGAVYALGAELLGSIMEPAAARAAELLDHGQGSMLDLGAGACPWSRAVRARNGAVAVTAVDLPAVIEAVSRNAALDGITLVAADLFEEPLPVGPFDLVLLGNLCHLFPADVNRRLIGRAADAVRPGGTLAIVDVLADHIDDPTVALYAVDLATRAPRGGVYSAAQFGGWMQRAQIASAPPIRLDTGLGLSLMTGVKAA